MFIQLKHESNELIKKDSRSWDYISFSGNFLSYKHLILTTKLWLPLNKAENLDLMNYIGFGKIALHHMTKNELWWFSCTLNPRKGWGNTNILFNAAFKITKEFNQYLFVQYYNGYAEGLLNYNQYTHNIRIGICIKPKFLNFY